MRRYLCEPMLFYKEPGYYNCHECFNTDCGYWADYNYYEEEKEETRERILDPDWQEFFNATCERYRKND